MDATALRASTRAGGTGAITTAATTNGPSSSAPTNGGGPVAAPTQPALLGERLLPAPVGEPQTIHLSDGSMLVPIARVDASGNRIPLSGGPGSAPLTGGGNTAATQTAGGTLHAAEGAPVSADGVAHADDDFEPLGFLYNDNYYKRYFDGGGIDTNDRGQVEERAVESTILYLHDKEPNVDDFGVTGIGLRRADAVTDKDLLEINPRAQWIIDVHGVQGDGKERTIPTVMNRDGATFTDPRIGRW